MRSLALVCLLTVLGSASAAYADEGWLHLRTFPDVTEREGHGARHAQLYIYDAQGEVVHSGSGAGAWDAGVDVPLDEGWYYTSVGTQQSTWNLQKLYVAADHVTIVPSGMVSALTLPLDEQPQSGCNEWNAELTVFVRDDEGREHLIATNRGSGVRDFGMIQVPAGEVVVHFNGLPTTVDVLADHDNRMPLGYQDPLMGDLPQLAIAPEDAESNIRVSLCNDGAMHVPAGTYYASSIVEIPTYPFQQRQWVTVEVAPTDDHGPSELRTNRVSHRVWTGEGSTPAELGAADAEVLERLRSGGGGEGGGGGPSLGGFGR